MSKRNLLPGLIEALSICTTEDDREARRPIDLRIGDRIREIKEQPEPCGGHDHTCLVAEARGEHNRCQGKCAYDES